jgi:hypothetical protein
MNINSTRVQTANSTRANQKAAPAPQQAQTSETSEPKETYQPWVPFANAGVVGAAVAVPTAIGAIGNSLFPNAGPIAKLAMVTGTSVAAGLGVGLYTAKGAKEEFNGHPILTGITTFVAGGAAALGAAVLSPIGFSYGWTGAGVATAVGAIGAGVISAVGIHAANKKAAG